MDYTTLADTVMEPKMDKVTALFNITPKLLGITDVEIINVRMVSDGSIHIEVRSTKSETLCRNCKSPTQPYGKGRRLTLRHLSMFGHEVYIEITPPRGICKRCDNHPTTTQTLDWFKRNARHTQPYDDYLMLQMVGSTQTDIAKKEGLTEEILQGVIDRQVQDKIDWKTVKRIGLLGIDEIAKKKGYQDYLTLIYSRHDGGNEILAVIEGKKKADIQAFLSSIPKKKRKTIAGVCVDMCDNYIDAIRSVFGKEVPIIVDRFHVGKLYRGAIRTLRSEELKRLKKELTEDEYKLLKPAIRILIKKNECYSKKEKKMLEPLFKLSPAIKMAYRLAREFTHIYNTHHKKKTAKIRMCQWIEKVENSSTSCFKKFIKTLIRYEDYICNYFLKRETSGFVEGLNNKVKVIKRRCYGFLNVKNIFQRIFLDFHGYDIFLKKQGVIVF